MKNISRIKSIAQIAILAALYVAINYAFAFMSFGNIQFRLAEMLVLLVFYNRKYAISVVLGCVIANIGSPLGWIDIVVGSGSTLIACLMMMPFKRNIWIASLAPTITCVLVAWELSYVFGTPFWYNVATVLPCEFAVVTIVGVPLMKLITRNRQIVMLMDLRVIPRKSLAPPELDTVPAVDDEPNITTSSNDDYTTSDNVPAEHDKDTVTSMHDDHAIADTAADCANIVEPK